jgi:hypothetical protein
MDSAAVIACSRIQIGSGTDFTGKKRAGFAHGFDSNHMNNMAFSPKSFPR